MTFSDFSIFSVLIPVLTGFLFLKRLESLHKYLLFFLTYGFLTDMLCVYLFTVAQSAVKDFFYNFFAVAEAIFMIFFFSTILNKKSILKWTGIYYAVMVAFYISINFLTEITGIDKSLGRSIYEIFYLIIGAVLGASVLLKLSEREKDLIHRPAFWLVLGLFFYAFCAFFLFGLRGMEIIKKVWFLHSSIVLVTNVFFFLGFYMYRDRKLIPQQNS